VDRVLSEEVTTQVSYALRGVVDRGTATAARLGVPVAGKTGTTQDNRDAWFVGYLPNGMTAAVWMGYDPVDTDGDGELDTVFMNNVHGRSVTGGSFPAEIWRDFMSQWLDITGAEVGSFPTVGNFPGTILNEELQITTSTLPECGAPAEGGSTTVQCRPTTTTAPISTTTTAPPPTSSPPTSAVTSTSAPPGTTSTLLAPP
jgi:membrane peptidoglycan carboxypeptidase